MAAQAQTTKKVFVVFETQDAITHQYEKSGESTWREQVPYKHRVRIIIAPFDVPLTMSQSMEQELSNQISAYILKSHLKEFEKFKLHTEAYNFRDLDYTEREYGLQIHDCADCNYQYEKSIITGFSFIPREAHGFSDAYLSMHKYIVGKPWPQTVSRR